ncbi:LysR family transcriptional regulator [Amycolatopsis sp. NPDC059090]|uniref:LysR family transcriptional regulator n=1 Tax=Amycolatopsis sp. NPDC059090 TaxID=3346723 RepID=UPI003670C142
MVDVRGLLLLHELRVRGTLALAADALHISHSAASHRLAVLEREVGTPIAERVGRRLQLTSAGQALAECAERVKTDLDSTDAVIETVRDTVSGRVKIGLFQTAALRVFPRLLDDLRETYPGVRLESSQMLAAAALSTLQTGGLDVAIVPSYLYDPAVPPAGFHVDELYAERLHLMLPAAHPLAGRDAPIEITELRSEQWIAGETIDHLVSKLCRTAGFEPDIVHRTSDYVLMTMLVSSGHGISILPVSTNLAEHLPPVVLKPLALAKAHYRVLAVMRETSRRRPAVAAVIAAMRMRA